jgi:hypothetical protein
VREFLDVRHGAHERHWDVALRTERRSLQVTTKLELHAEIARFVGRLIRWQRPPLRAEMGTTVVLPQARAA